MAQVVLTAEAREDLRGLDGQARIIVARALKKLEVEPEKRGVPLGAKAGGDLTTFRKLVVGDRDYRIVYRVEKDATVTVVWVIGRRTDDECHRLAVSRLKAQGSSIADLVQQLLDAAFKDNRGTGGS